MRPYFDGCTYSKKHDLVRLNGQINRIYNLMKDGEWRTLSEIENKTNDQQASISAQLRNLRKERFGSYTVEKRPRGNRDNGLFEYRVKK